jgi:hypothetical protein
LKENPLSDAKLSAFKQHRIFAESYILRCIAAFDAPAQKRLMDACPGAPYATADEALDDFESSESITGAQVEWIADTWRERKKTEPDANPRRFAEEVANRVFSDIDF